VLDGIRIYRYPSPVEAHSLPGYALEYGNALFWHLLYSTYLFLKFRFRAIQICNPPDMLFPTPLLFKMLCGATFVYDHHDICPELYLNKKSRGKNPVYALLLALERLTYRFADYSIETNESFRKLALERGGMEPEKVRLVRTCPDLKDFSPECGSARGKKARTVAGYLGVIGEQEGLDILVEAAAEIAQRRSPSEMHFLVIGDGTYAPTIKKRTAELGLSEYFTFTGYLTGRELNAALCSCDMFVAPDHPNPMNDKSAMNKIMEYMSIGRPIIMFNLKENRKLAGGAALITPALNVDRFAKNIELLADRPDVRDRLGARGLERIRGELNWNAEKRKYVALYKEILGPAK
jgi:glycosyltransferase involved in cell wall biosynthesis